MINKKQIDNLSKYCYDVSKLVMSFAVIGNFLSDKFSKHTFWIGLIATCVFLVMGLLIDRTEVNKDVKH